jgi:hypothetical protein
LHNVPRFPADALAYGRWSRLRQARDQAELDWIIADAEDDRDRGRRRLRGERARGVAGCCDDGDAATDEVTHHCGQAIILAAQPMVFDRHVLALDKAGFVKTAAERGAKRGVGRSGVHEADHRHRRLLRVCRGRPRRRAAEKRDKVAASHFAS